MRNAAYALIFTMLASPAFAVDLTVDQTQTIFMPDGKTPKMTCDAWSEGNPPVCQHQIPATVGSVIQDVLTAQLIDPSGRGQDPTNAKSGNLAIRIYGEPKPILKADEITMILARVDRMEDPVTIARMHEFLEPSK